MFRTFQKSLFFVFTDFIPLLIMCATTGLSNDSNFPSSIYMRKFKIHTTIQLPTVDRRENLYLNAIVSIVSEKKYYAENMYLSRESSRRTKQIRSFTIIKASPRLPILPILIKRPVRRCGCIFVTVIRTGTSKI